MKIFKIKMENSKIFSAIIDTLASIVEDTQIKVTPKQFTITAFDPSRICVFNLILKKEVFDEYQCDKEEKIGINLSDMKKIIMRSTSDDSIEITFLVEEQRIKIVFIKKKTGRRRTFSLALIDVEVEEIPIENLLRMDFPALWSFDIGLFDDIVKDGEIYSEIINIKASKEGLLFKSVGQVGEMESELTPEDLTSFETSDDSMSAYSVVFLKSMLKIKPIVEKMDIALKTNSPLKVTINLLEGGLLYYFLAPRVEEAEFDSDDDSFDDDNDDSFDDDDDDIFDDDDNDDSFDDDDSF